MLGIRPRKRWGFACLAAGAVLVVDPLATLAATPAAATNVGTSAVTVGLPAATVTDPTGVARNVALGTVIAQSESTPQLLSSIALSGTNLLGHAVPGPTYTTSSGPQSGSYDVPVPTGLPVTGAVNLAHFQLSALSGATSSVLSALTGQVGVPPLNLTSNLGQHGITTQVTPTTSTSAASFVISALSLKLSDILPASVLNGLPLGAVLSLVQQLNLPVGSLAPVLSAVNQLQTTLQSLDKNLTDLASAQTQLTSLASSALQSAESAVAADTQELAQLQSTLTSDQNAVTAAQSAVTADQTALAAANQTLLAAQTAATADCVVPATTLCTTATSALTAAQATVTSDTNKLNTDQATLTAAQSALASLQTQISNVQQQLATDQATVTSLLNSASPAVQQAAALVKSLTATVNGLLTQLQGLLNQLQGTNLTSLLKTLTSSIGNTGLVDLGPITSALNTSADATSGTASATCSPSSLSVLGVAVPVPSCAAVDQGLATLTGKLGSVLKLLPVNVPQLQVSGLQTTSQATPKPAADGTTSASSGLTALHLSLPQMKLSALADQLTQNLQQQLQQLLTSLGGSATTAAAVRSAALPSVLSLPGVTIPAGVTTLLSSVLTQLNALPTGQALQGLATVGLDLTGAAIGTTATFKAAGATTSPMGTSTSGTPAAGPSPATPAPSGSLPLTGANPVGILASGLLLLVIGYYLLVLADWRRPAAIRTTAQEPGRG